MGSFNTFETAECGGRRPGKIEASLNEELSNVEWGEYKIGDLFEVKSYKKRFDANKVQLSDKGHPYIVRMSTDNGRKGFIEEDEIFLNEGNTLSFGQDTATIFYQEKPYFTGDKIKILKPRFEQFNKSNAQFFVAAITQAFQSFAWGTSSFSIETIEKQNVQLPSRDGKINFSFMEKFITELEAQHVAELEAYLAATELKNYELTDEEQKALIHYDKLDWNNFNLEVLFGKSTRGKRLKSADRIAGNLPFVTAGESNEGVSAFIGNNVTVFPKNTTTIDMFGSAKYRNYAYGGDDHIAVVHTEKLSKYAAIFTTAAIHKSSHTGKFDYGHNFYAKDADELFISLPIKDNKPDYTTMETLISAIQKLVIRDVVLYADKKIRTTKEVIED